MTSTPPPFGPATPATPTTAAPAVDTTRQPGPRARCRISSPELAIGVTPYLLGYHPEPGGLVIHGFRDQRLILTVATHHPVAHHLVPHRDQPAPTDPSGADPSADPGDDPGSDAAEVLVSRALRAVSDPLDPAEIDAVLVIGYATSTPTTTSTPAARAVTPDVMDEVLVGVVERPVPPEPTDAARFLAALRSTAVRDACLLWADDAAWWLWTDLAPLAPPTWRAPVLTLIAAAACRRGDGVTSMAALAHALTDDPAYLLAQLMHQVITLGIPPDTWNDGLREITDRIHAWPRVAAPAHPRTASTAFTATTAGPTTDRRTNWTAPAQRHHRRPGPRRTPGGAP